MGNEKRSAILRDVLSRILLAKNLVKNYKGEEETDYEGDGFSFCSNEENILLSDGKINPEAGVTIVSQKTDMDNICKIFVSRGIVQLAIHDIAGWHEINIVLADNNVPMNDYKIEKYFTTINDQIAVIGSKIFQCFEKEKKLELRKGIMQREQEIKQRPKKLAKIAAVVMLAAGVGYAGYKGIKENVVIKKEKPAPELIILSNDF